MTYHSGEEESVSGWDRETRVLKIYHGMSKEISTGNHNKGPGLVVVHLIVHNRAQVFDITGVGESKREAFIHAGERAGLI